MSTLLLCLTLGATQADAKKPKVDPVAAAQAQAYAAVDQTMVQALERAKTAYDTAPGINPLYGWAGSLSGAGQAGTLGRGAVSQEHLDAFFAGVEAHGADPAGGGETVGLAADVALAAGRKGQALVLAQRALATKPTNAALLTWFATSNDPSKAPAHCKSTLAAAQSDIQRYDTISACDAVLGEGWVGGSQRSFYEAETARRAGSQAAHTAQLQAELKAQAAEMQASRDAWEASRPAAEASSAEGSSSGSGGSGVVSVSLKVTCGSKVRMFEGSSPSSGGTYGWQSPNSVRNLSVRAGDVLCIADDRDKVQSCWTASGDRVSLELGCGGFMQR